MPASAWEQGGGGQLLPGSVEAGLPFSTACRHPTEQLPAAHLSGQCSCSRSMQSKPSRCKLPSIAAAMLAAFSAAGPPRSHVMPPGPATLVATVKASRPCGCFLSQAPRISSDRPCSSWVGEW